MDIRKMFINGNSQFQLKLIKDLEKIEIRGKIPKYPVLILTCMDPRIDIHRIFQLEPGDVLVLRNAGNIITNDILRSILIAIHEYNIKNVFILGHIDCGMTKIKLNNLKSKMLFESYKLICREGKNPMTEIRRFFKPFADEIINLRTQTEKLINFKGISHAVRISGFLYDVATGWIFDYETIKSLKIIENFKQKYRDLLHTKRLQFVDFIEANENQIVNSGGLITKSGEGVKIEFNEGIEAQIPSTNIQTDDDLVNQEIFPNGKQLFKFPMVNVPKIILPKIRVNMPNIYKKRKQGSAL